MNTVVILILQKKIHSESKEDIKSTELDEQGLQLQTESGLNHG